MKKTKSESLETGTTYEERFVDALTVFLGSVPPIAYVKEWIANEPHCGSYRLQEWVCGQDRLPVWAQGIVFLEAIHVMVNDPCEGCDHIIRKVENKWKNRSDTSYKIGDVLDLNICGTIGNNVIIGKETNRIKNMVDIDDMVLISQWRYASGK